MVNNNFIRLTPDRQSKKGSLWSRKSLNTNAISAILKFRISGSGKNFFGDGIALWFVQQGYYTEGTLHGFQEKFKGVGIIFDTFKNTETADQHRDVTILINDGKKTFEVMTKDVKGCNTNIRYHAERADFSVTDASRAKIIINGTNLIVAIDGKNTGSFTECVNLNDLDVPGGSDWLKSAYIGISATTGQLADNHDIISLSVYSDHEVMEKEAASPKTYFDEAPNLDNDERMKRLENAVNALISKLEYFDHHIEHELASITDDIDNMINKLQKREGDTEAKVENLEDIVKREVEGTLDKRMAKMEENLKGNMNKKITKLESTIDQKITTGGQDKNASYNYWKLAFWIVTIVLIIGGVLFYSKIQKELNKFHLP